MRVINWYEVSSIILEHMGDKGWDAKDLVAHSGVSKQTVYKLLNGGAIKLESLLDICDALNITPDLLFGYLDRRGKH